MKKEKVLEVNNLKISFRTPNGLVRAVRDISFDLYKGETLAIVGESGSGKSVTNRAIMGILAGNGIIDDGSILYREQDLAKLSEANFHAIRGNKIGMIFQDPLSSLNPTMKIGKQITEAMLINGNRIKNKMVDMYHTEYYEYLNKKKELDLARKNAKTRIFEIQLDDTISKQEKKTQITTVKNELRGKLSDINAEIPTYKKKYIEKKEQAKKDVKADVAQIKVDEKVELKSLKANLLEQKKLLETFTKGSEDYSNQLKKINKVKDNIRNNRENFKRKLYVTKKEAYTRAIEIMNEVGIPEPEKRFNQYPFQFSGGMRQRVVIAIALMANPEVLICDEPTTALDVTIQGQILNLIKKLKKQRDLSVIFITHDLGVVANVADRVAVMYAGKIVEYGTSEDVFYNPKHPYTWALLSSVPDLDTKEKLLSIPGTPPDMLYPPKGDAFADRNQFALKIDFEEQPPFFKISESHYAASWLLHEDAPKVDMPNIVKDRIEKYKAQEKTFQQSKGAQA
jgi:oligopeptide transport system ATP-binding protein